MGARRIFCKGGGGANFWLVRLTFYGVSQFAWLDFNQHRKMKKNYHMPTKTFRKCEP